METFNEELYESLKSRYEIIIENPELGPDSVLQVDQGIEEDGGAEAELES